MPIKDGNTTTKEIIEYEEKNQIKATPIVALTAYCLERDKEQAFKVGHDSFLTKPIRKQILLNEISKFLDKD